MKNRQKLKSRLISEISELGEKLANIETSSLEPLDTKPAVNAFPCRSQKTGGEILLSSERDMLISILEAMNTGVFLIDQQFNFVYVNPVAEREFGPVGGRKCYQYFRNRSEVCPWCGREKVANGRSVRRVYTESKSAKIYDVFETPVINSDGLVLKLAVLHDITRHRKTEEALKLDELRFEALIKLSQMTSATPVEIAQFVLEQAVSLTGSKFGFMGFLDETECRFTLNIMSKSTSRKCAAQTPVHFRIEHGGLWSAAVKQRKPHIVNDFESSNPLMGALPKGHLRLKKFLSIPIFHGDRIVAVAAVANKSTHYEDSDVRHLVLLMGSMWKLIQRVRDQEKLRDSEEQMRFLASKLLAFLEEERARVAHEIHTDIGQMLAAMKFGAESTIKAARNGDTDKMISLLSSYIEMLKAAIDNSRQLYMDLRPTVLDDFGVIAAVFWLCAHFQESYPDITVEKKIEVEEQRIPEDLKLTIFRVFQEALNNSAAHSKADRIKLALTAEENIMELNFSDNGTGFDLSGILSTTSTTRGLGLAAMKERIHLSGGTFSIDSKVGGGTQVKASWELESMESGPK
jgi:PAS domain S-box-containing protein